MKQDPVKSLEPARTSGELVRREPYPMMEEQTSSGAGLLEYWRILRRHKGTVLVALVLGGILGSLTTLPDTPIYQAKATLEVQGLNENFLNMRDVNPTAVGGGFDSTLDIMTQVKIMDSQWLRDRVMAKMKTQKDATLYYPTDRLSAWKKAFGLDPGPAVKREEAVAMAAGGVGVRATGTTRIIEVSCDALDPKLAAEVANMTVNEFIEGGLDARLKATERTSEWLTQQLEALRIKLERSEDQLQAYAAEAGLQYTGDRGKEGTKENVAEEKYRQLQTELLKAQSERVGAQSKYELAKTSSSETLPQVLDDSSLRDYQNKLTELRRQLAELNVSLTAAHPRVKSVEAQVKEIEGAMEKERGNIVARIKNEFEGAQRRETLISSEHEAQSKIVNDQAGKAIHYNILQREVDTNRQVYETMLQKVKEAGIATAMRASNYRVVDVAQAPGGPYKPNSTRAATTGAVLGILLGFGFVILRERADRSLQQPGDLAAYVNAPELGVIPSEKAGLARRRYGQSAAANVTNGNGNGLAIWKNETSSVAESFRATLTSILFSGKGGVQPKVIAFSSAGPSEGKSTVSSNLAVALAEINQRVLLIDADMRRPRLHEMLGVPNTDGLSTLLNEKSGIRPALLGTTLRETGIAGLTLLTSGQWVPSASNLLYSPRLAELIRTFRGQFDVVLIDTPPMLHLADARVIGQHCDAVILVVRAGKTTRDMALAAWSKFQEDGTPVLGTILNDWDPGSSGLGYGGGYYGGYAKYYGKEK